MSTLKNPFGSVSAFSAATTASSNSGTNVVSAFSNLADLNSSSSSVAVPVVVASTPAAVSSAVKFKAASFAVPNESSMSAPTDSLTTAPTSSSTAPTTTSTNANSTALTSNLSGLAAKLAAAKRSAVKGDAATSSTAATTTTATTTTLTTATSSSSSTTAAASGSSAIAALLAANAAAASFVQSQPEHELKSFSAVSTAASQDSAATDAFKGGSLVFDSAADKADKAAQPASPPPKIEAHTGEENETTAFQARATLFVLQQNAGQNEWRERGNGNLKVNLQKGGRARLLLRQEGSLKVILNAALQYKMPYITVGERAVRFIVCDTSTDDHRPQSWLARFGRSDEAESLMGALRMALVTVPKPREASEGEGEAASLSGKKRSLDEQPRQVAKKSNVETKEGETAAAADDNENDDGDDDDDDDDDE